MAHDQAERGHSSLGPSVSLPASFKEPVRKDFKEVQYLSPPNSAFCLGHRQVGLLN